jgi:hypothetical protein
METWAFEPCWGEFEMMVVAVGITAPHARLPAQVSHRHQAAPADALNFAGAVDAFGRTNE